MGRKYLTLKGTPRGTHFIWDERLKLQYYYNGCNGYEIIQSPTLCEKTLYNWVEAGDIPNVTINDLPPKGKLKKKRRGPGKPKHSNVEYASRSIDKRPSEINDSSISKTANVPSHHHLHIMT